MPKPVVQEGEDPDPTPYLFVSLEQKRIDQSKPYDGKKACWVPDEKEGFVQGEIKATKGDLVTVNLPGGEVNYVTNTLKNLDFSTGIIIFVTDCNVTSIVFGYHTALK